MNCKRSNFKIAVVHDALIEWGGGEKVLNEILEIFPNADVYTSICLPNIKKKLTRLKKREIYCSWLQRYWNKNFPRRIIQLLAPIIWPTFDLRNYDVVLIHSGFYMSKLVTLRNRNKEQKRICYLITPPKNIHSSIAKWELPLFHTYYQFLRYLDKQSNRYVTDLYVVSSAVSKRVKDIYQKQSKVLYPPCFDEKKKVHVRKKRDKVFGYFGRLSQEKNLNLLIKTFKLIPELKLEIVGNGDMKNFFKKKSSDNVKFLGYLSGKKLENQITSWSAIIHPAIHDDFPLSVVEALHLGTPAICHQSGGVTDYILEGINGFYFKENTVESLNLALEKHLHHIFSSVKVKKSVKAYSKEQFTIQLKRIMNEKN